MINEWNYGPLFKSKFTVCTWHTGSPKNSHAMLLGLIKNITMWPCGHTIWKGFSHSFLLSQWRNRVMFLVWDPELWQCNSNESTLGRLHGWIKLLGVSRLLPSTKRSYMCIVVLVGNNLIIIREIRKTIE